MSLNTSKAGKLLLTAGLVFFLAQGLWQLPDLQDYLFPGSQLATRLQTAREECQKIEEDLTVLGKRIDDLNWFLAHNGLDHKVSVDRWRTSPSSEGLRLLSPHFFWYVNMYLAKRIRVKEERRLRYLEALLNNLDLQLQPPSCPKGAAVLPHRAAQRNAREQIEAGQRQLTGFHDRLRELTQKLTWIERQKDKK